jgi:hypothetical protein
MNTCWGLGDITIHSRSNEFICNGCLHHVSYKVIYRLRHTFPIFNLHNSTNWPWSQELRAVRVKLNTLCSSRVWQRPPSGRLLLFCHPLTVQLTLKVLTTHVFRITGLNLHHRIFKSKINHRDHPALHSTSCFEGKEALCFQCQFCQVFVVRWPLRPAMSANPSLSVTSGTLSISGLQDLYSSLPSSFQMTIVDILH